jgi:anti-sigma regulatory factor (Ser/Thr protein kinase)
VSDRREIHVAADLQAARRLRADVRAAAAALGAPEPASDAMALVVDELFNNAIEHGASYRQKRLDLVLRVSMADAHLQLDFFDPEMPESQVIDLGRSMRAAVDGLPSLESERGRGLFLISIYMAEVRVDVAPGGGLHLFGKLATG